MDAGNVGVIGRKTGRRIGKKDDPSDYSGGLFVISKLFPSNLQVTSMDFLSGDNGGGIRDRVLFVENVRDNILKPGH